MSSNKEKMPSHNIESYASFRLFDDDTPENVLEILISRYEQSVHSRLCEYITGLPLESPKLAERIINDQRIVRGKYRLPFRNILLEDPAQYETSLREIADQQDVEIVDKSDCGNFFDVHSAGAVFFEENRRAGVTIENDTYETM